MATEKRLIDANEFLNRLNNCVYDLLDTEGELGYSPEIIKAVLGQTNTVDAVVFPCKVGDTVWFVGTSNANRLKAGIVEATVEKLVLKSGGIYMKLSCNSMYETSCRSIGKSVFFSREEAEAALAKMERKDDT